MRGGRKTRCAAAAALATISACAALAGSADAAVPRDFFGVVPSGYDSTAEMQRMAANGVGAVRLLVNWNLVEPRQGVRDWTYYDNYVAGLAAAGLQAQHQLPGDRASARYGRNGLFWKQHPTLPYLPMVDWEVWNGPSLSDSWGTRPNRRKYVRLLRLTGTGVRSADPRTRIGIGIGGKLIARRLRLGLEPVVCTGGRTPSPLHLGLCTWD